MRQKFQWNFLISASRARFTLCIEIFQMQTQKHLLVIVEFTDDRIVCQHILLSTKLIMKMKYHNNF